MTSLITLPLVPFTSCEFDPVQPQNVERMEGRRVESQAFGTAYWTAKFTTGYLTPIEYGLMDAFLMRCAAGGVMFLGYDAFRPRPILHNQKFSPLLGEKAGGGIFVGDAKLRQILNSTTVIVEDLPAGFQLSAGDYLEIRKAELVRSLHRIMAPATADASGRVTLSIQFALDLQHFTLPCTAHFEKPSCTMQIDPGSARSPKSWEDRGVTFTATEMFFDA